MAAPASPAAKVTAPSTTALAASTRPRRGLAASVTRIRPRRYSAVMNIAPTTTTAISPANVPIRVCATVTPTPPPPDTAGAMSPEPVTVNAASGLAEASGVARRRAACRRPGRSPVHEPPGQPPSG